MRLSAIYRGSLPAACLLLLSAGCLNWPRNNQVIASKSTDVAFDGFYYDVSNAEIKLFIKNNNNGAFEQIPHAPILTGTTQYVDNSDEIWYYFSATDVALPGDAKYWSAGAGRTIITRVKALGPGNQPLTTFDYGEATDDCINLQLQTGGAAVMNNCDSASSPVVKLIVNCGTANKDCCLSGDACDFGKNCSSGLCSVSCGALNQPCCNTATKCSAGNVCTSGTCVACKPKGTACTSSGECCTGNVCSGGVCKPPCTQGQACNVPGKLGPCKNGQTDCSGLDPVCVQTTFPTSDANCNNVDDDCDGTKDDNYASTSCSVAPSGCQAGFSVTGTTSCQSGSVVCNAQEGTDYCTQCGGACGECSATPCTPGTTKCIPGFVCKTGATMGCGINDPSTACWPIDGAHCSGCTGLVCWKPSDVTVAGQCP